MINCSEKLDYKVPASLSEIVNMLCRIRSYSPYVGNNIISAHSFDLKEIDALRQIAFYSSKETRKEILDNNSFNGIII